MTSSKSPTLLIVEDEQHLRELLHDICRDLSANIQLAANGREAFEILQKQHVDAILSDLNMPKMNGLDLLREIRKLGHDTPFVILTGFGDKETTVQALQLGAFDFIDKPFDDDKLKEVVRSALDLGTALHSASREFEEIYKDSNLTVDQKERLKRVQTSLLSMKKITERGLKKS